MDETPCFGHNPFPPADGKYCGAGRAKFGVRSPMKLARSFFQLLIVIALTAVVRTAYPCSFAAGYFHQVMRLRGTVVGVTRVICGIRSDGRGTGCQARCEAHAV